MNKKDFINELKDVEYHLRCILKSGPFNSTEWDHLYEVVDSLSIQILAIEKGKYEVKNND